MEKNFKNWNYFIQTFGCQMNVHESEKMAGVLKNLGMGEAKTSTEADVVVINTCAIRESAEKKIESFIGNLKAPKAKGVVKCVVLVGCMTQQTGRAESIKKKFPFVDLIIGTMNLSNFKELFFKWADTNKSQIEILETRTGKDIDEINRTSGVNAWVNISFGCNNFCTYCIVPYVRGREISRPMPDIISEVKALLDQGYKQITLLGQNVNSYGNDIEDESITFANLLREIDKLDYKFRLRFMTSHPKDLNDDVIKAIKEGTHICHSIHLPAQSGSTKILKEMNRKYTREHYFDLVSRIREQIPDVELTTDIIVGFPDETDEDFEDTLSLIQFARYQQIFGFIYSKRRGTIAEKMQNQIPLPLKKERLARLIELEREIASEISASYVGKTVEVLIEGTNKNYLVGSTDQNKNVNIVMPDDKEIDELVGKFVNVKITNSKLTVLYGEII
ncbi:MAG: tRNA (N6-isopentenyl adenosine(37)-C2)-methylthiotransferase MiaB [Clostridia bacterium]|nr:tRNA (N6-isopentenyl adenosine(37)-C2)-methylthiotransferase MiaB [Clostridia bacterium]